MSRKKAAAEAAGTTAATAEGAARSSDADMVGPGTIDDPEAYARAIESGTLSELHGEVEDSRFAELRAELVELRAKLVELRTELAAVDNGLKQALRRQGDHIRDLGGLLERVSTESAPVGGGIRVRTKTKKRHFRAGLVFGRDWRVIKKVRSAQFDKIAKDEELEVLPID